MAGPERESRDDSAEADQLLGRTPAPPPVPPAGKRVPLEVILVLGLCCSVDAGDGALLATLFRSLERDLGITPAQLGLLSLCKSLALSCAVPIWGYWSDTIPKSRLLTAAALSWAVTAWLVGLSPSYLALAGALTINAAGLAAITPLSVAFMAELCAPASRGSMFGILYLFQSLGSAAGQNFAMWAAADSWGPGGSFAGWRLPYFCVGVVALPLALASHIVLGRRRAAPAPTAASSGRVKLTARQAWGSVSQLKTVWLITAQGLIGSLPWRAFDFLTIYLQYCGLGDSTAALTASAFTFGQAAGSLFGGLASDMFWRCSPQHGRIYLVQIADGLRIPLVFYIFYDPRDVGPSTAYWLFALGFFAPWVAVANKAIIAEVAPSKVLGSAVAMNAAMEGVFSSLVGAPLVGFLSQYVFGYVLPPLGATVAEMPAELRTQNAAALGSALFYMASVPWVICFCLYTLTHWTYPADLARRAACEEEDESESGVLLESADTSKSDLLPLMIRIDGEFLDDCEPRIP